MKRISVFFSVLIALLALAAGIHMAVACRSILRSMSSAPAWVGLLVGIPYLAAALAVGAVWLAVFLRRRCKNKRIMQSSDHE